MDPAGPKITKIRTYEPTKNTVFLLHKMSAQNAVLCLRC